MANLTECSVILDQSQIDFIKTKIAIGDYGDTSEVVRAGLAALVEREAQVETWLQTKVAATFDLSVQDPYDVVGIDKAFAQVRAARQKRVAA